MILMSVSLCPKVFLRSSPAQIPPVHISVEIMGRGVSYGGGQSSLGYLFGGGEAPAPKPARNETDASKGAAVANHEASIKPAAAPANSVGVTEDTPAGIQRNKNNYFRPDGQNCGNFITFSPDEMYSFEDCTGSSMVNCTAFCLNLPWLLSIQDRPSTKVHAEPGGGSSLGYLFGGGKNN
ncbi:hypothetical protein Cgig2_030737 [Carnegiea gigantea]|uniref:Uncharacterized protein n=1 Tax=Carnegiea gigantea TaxID=171969 RepID=A0A9Q1KU51_9CARY|nr:hypothetical protein Cgig2_030737 [Carnegiea gigantea]